MAAMVSSEKRMRKIVFRYVRNISRGENPISSPATFAASRIPVPVAESQLNVNTAVSGLVGFSGVAFGTTGGARVTTMCNPAIWKFGAEILSSDDFTFGKPQKNKIRVSRIHGVHARRSAAFSQAGSDPSRFRVSSASGTAGEMPAQLSFGLQNFSSTTSATMDETDAIMSTSIGPMRFETRNCGTANATPATSAASQILIMPRKPAIAHTTQNGTMSEKNGSCR